MTCTRRQLAVLLVSLAVWLLASPAAAWIETRVLGDDVRIEVDRAGMATVEHAIGLQVRGGPLRSFDLLAADRDAVPLEDSTVASAKAADSALPIPLSVTQRPDGSLRVSIEHPRGLGSGQYLFRIRYRTNLVATSALERDGAMLRLAWAGPIWSEGLGNARTTFVLPPAPTAPRASGPEGEDPALAEEAASAGTRSFLSELRRHPDRDEIELIRPHIARREQALWSIRFDPRALGEVSDARLAPPPPPPAEPTLSERIVSLVPVGMALLLAFSILVAWKGQQVLRFATLAGVDPRPLVPLGLVQRSLLAGPVGAGGIILQGLLDQPVIGSVLLLGAVALTTYLTPRWKPRPRGPGRWLPITDADAFTPPSPPKGLVLDFGTRAGRLAFSLCLVACAAASVLAWNFVSPYHGYLIAFDAALLVPLFGTGRLGQLPPDLATAPAKMLLRMARKLRDNELLRVVPSARLPQGSDRFDELRLLVVPRLPRRGFGAIEIGMAWARGAGGALALPQVIVRVVDGSPCHEALLRELGQVRWMRGRKPDERVAIVSPRLPTAAQTSALALRIAEAARDPERATRQPKPVRSEAVQPSTTEPAMA